MAGIPLLTGADLRNQPLTNATLESSTSLDTAKQFGYDTTNEVLAWRTTGNTAKNLLSVALNLFAAPTGDVTLNSHKITNLANGVNATDAVNKGQLDAAITGLDWKESVRVASTGNVNIATGLENGDTLDGVTLVTGDRVLLKNQTAAEENGVYVVVASGAASRSTDADVNAEVTAGLTVFVAEGTVNQSTKWTIITPDPIVLGTTALSFAQIGGVDGTIGGSGITQSGVTLSIAQTGTTLTIGADTVDVNLATNGGLEDSSGVKVKVDTTSTGGTASVVKIGANGTAVGVDNSTIEGSAAGGVLRVKDLGITTAKLNATSVTAAKLGSDVAGNGLTGGNGSAISALSDTTGGANLAKAVNVSANGLAVKVDSTTITSNGSNQLSINKTYVPVWKEFTSVGGANTEVFTHNLNNQDLIVSVKKISTNEQEIAGVIMTSVNTITVDFGADPSTDYKVYVTGLDKN